MALEDAIYTSAVLNIAQEPPRDSSIDSFNSNNLICAGSSCKIEDSRRCTILNSESLYLYQKYNSHCVGVDFQFYVKQAYYSGIVYRVVLNEYYQNLITSIDGSNYIKIKTRDGWIDLRLEYSGSYYYVNYYSSEDLAGERASLYNFYLSNSFYVNCKNGLSVLNVYYSEWSSEEVYNYRDYVYHTISGGEIVLFQRGGAAPGTSYNPSITEPDDELEVMYFKVVERNFTLPPPTRSIQVKNSNVIESCADIISNNLSDERLKKNSSNIKNSLSLLSKINAVSFSWNERQGVLKGDDIGLIAQEVERCFPLASNTRSDGVKSIDYRKMIPILVSCVKEKQKKIDNLKSKIKEIKDYI
jgi:hypothetical protein